MTGDIAHGLQKLLFYCSLYAQLKIVSCDALSLDFSDWLLSNMCPVGLVPGYLSLLLLHHPHVHGVRQVGHLWHVLHDVVRLLRRLSLVGDRSRESGDA